MGDKRRPFQNADFRGNADFRKLPLNNLRAFLAGLIALIGQNFKRKGPAVLVQQTVAVCVRPPRLLQKFARFGRVVGVDFHFVVVRPGARLVGPRRRFAQSQQNPADDFVFIDGVGYGLSHAPVRKKRVFQIIAQIRVGKSQIAIFVEIFPEQIVLRLPRVLQRCQPHHAEVLRAKLQKHGCGVGNDPRNPAVQIGSPLKIILVGHQNDFLTRNPFLEPVGPGADGVARKRALGNVFPREQVSGHHRCGPTD